jgi:hypothetical protein
MRGSAFASKPGSKRIVVLLAALAAACTMQRPTTEPFATIPGEWGFSKVDECASNPRVFSFHGNRKILRAAHQEDSEAGDGDVRKVFEYDVLGASDRELHVSLRGETRLDGAGKPVTWHLVIFDENTLRWRQSDWAEDEFTPELVRCRES